MPSSSSPQLVRLVASAGTQVRRRAISATAYMLLPASARFLTSLPNATGGAYDTVPEVAILLSLFNFSDKFYPTVFDEAG